MSEQNEIHRVLGRIEGKIDGIMTLVDGVQSDHKDLKVSHETLRTRVNTLENRIHLYVGAITVMSPVIFLFLKPVVERLWQ